MGDRALVARRLLYVIRATPISALPAGQRCCVNTALLWRSAMPSPYQIMIIEDERAVASMLVRAIQRQIPTIAVQTFVTGQEALTTYDRVGADLLVINHGLPDMAGSALIRMLRA